MPPAIEPRAAVGAVARHRSATQRPVSRAHASPFAGRSAAVTHPAATAPRAPPALALTVPRTALTTSTADLSVSAEAMQPPIETATVSATGWEQEAAGCRRT